MLNPIADSQTTTKNDGKILTNQLANTLALSCPKGCTLVSRREMLRTGLRDCLRIGIRSIDQFVLSGPAIGVALVDFGLPSLPDKTATKFEAVAQSIYERSEPEALYQKTTTKLPSGAILTNIGFVHTDLNMSKIKEATTQEIKRNDLVLMESETVGFGRHMRIDNYSHPFHTIRAICWKLNVPVFDIDVKHYAPQTDIVPAGISLLAGCALYGKDLVRYIGKKFRFGMSLLNVQTKTASPGLANLFAPGELSNDCNTPSKLTLRSFIRLIGWGASCFAFLAPLSLFVKRPGDYPRLDLSFGLDGRTVFMLDNILRCARAYPGKRIVVFSGAEHAKGFDYYLKNRASFESRLALYSKIYAKNRGEPERALPPKPRNRQRSRNTSGSK